MVMYYGDFAEDDTVIIPFNTFSSDDPSASVTITNLADADVKVHKDGGTTQIVTDGATVSIDFDTITGNHLITIDTSASADYSTGSEYQVRIEGTTVDGATINAWVGCFSIERASGALAIAKLIQAAVITNAAGTDISADVAAVKAETASILTDTGTTLPGQISAVKAETASILTDTGTTLPGQISALNDISVADVLTTQMTESYASDGVAPTLAQSIFGIQQFLHEPNYSGTTLTVKKLDGSTTAMTFTLDDGTNPTNHTRST